MQFLCTTIFENLCAKLLRTGHVPKHVAFVADGARRFGRKYDITVQENHEIGLYKVMFEIIDWCLLFGIVEYSILMYSFGNYYRPEDEVNHWIDVLRVWLIKLIQNWRILQKKGIRFIFYGKFQLIPADINALMALLQLITRENVGVKVNMVMGYTSTHEMSFVAHELIKSVKNGDISSEDLSEKLVQECLFAVENNNVDLLIRTSGYKRISNFMTWQVSNGMIYFENVLWPEFNKINFIMAIFYYNYHHTKKQNNNIDNDNNSLTSSLKITKYLDTWKTNRLNLLYRYLHGYFFPLDVQLKDIVNYDYDTLYDAFKNSYSYRHIVYS